MICLGDILSSPIPFLTLTRQSEKLMNTLEKQMKYNERLLEQSLRGESDNMEMKSPGNETRSPVKKVTRKDESKKRKGDIDDERALNRNTTPHSHLKGRSQSSKTTKSHHRSHERNKWIHDVLEGGDLADISQLLETLDPMIVQVLPTP